MKSLKSIFAVLLSIGMAFTIVSCGDDDTTTPVDPIDGNGKLTIHFDNKYDAMADIDLELNEVYATSSGDSITVSGIRYWISNIILFNGTDTAYQDEDGYYLVEKTADNTREMILIDEIPSGTYTSLEFALGVDPANNDTLGSGKGELSLSNGMFWAWNTGYKFLRLDGTYFEEDSSNYQPLRIHTGLNAYYIKKEIPLAANLVVTEGGDHIAHFMVSVKNMFEQPNSIELGEKDGIWMFFTEEPAWNRMNENISNMFMLHHAE
ncbi:hypothetical protein HZR84_10170 [Hyphobacterium sp. CCMP332]|nr:hypothetical protein HZR84_10170 [Hyphobacterium sp. CCMP332]